MLANLGPDFQLYTIQRIRHGEICQSVRLSGRSSAYMSCDLANEGAFVTNGVSIAPKLTIFEFGSGNAATKFSFGSL